jgi:2-(1,2-epoxy-1,2-dihydrophenyl)acetyl-CoA isomerase
MRATEKKKSPKNPERRDAAVSENPFLLEVDQSIAKITLNLPEIRNALSLEVRLELTDLFRRLGDEDRVKVIILTGSGQAFCAGGDIRTMEGVTPVPARIRLKKGHRLIKIMLGLEKPIIGAINGVTAGAGVSIALSCDYLIAVEKATFTVSFTKIGLVPDLGLYYLLPLRVGVPRAKEIMFLAETIDARKALDLGLINRIVPEEKLEEEARAFADRLKKGPGQSLAMIKAALNHWPAGLDSFLEMESTMQAVAFSSRDFDEGRRAFLEKRKPLFRGE